MRKRQQERCEFCRAVLSEMVGFVTAPALRFCLAPACMRRGFARAKVDISKLAGAGSPTVVTLLPAQVREMREARGWTVIELAERAGLSDSAVRAAESLTCSPRADTMFRLARALGKPLQIGAHPGARPSFATARGSWFRRARLAAGLSQAYVAEQAGCAQSSVSTFERFGRGPEHVIEAIAAVLEVDVPGRPPVRVPEHRRNGHAEARA